MPIAQAQSLDNQIVTQTTVFRQANEMASKSTIVDLLSKNQVRTIGDRVVKESSHANKQRVDAIDLDSWRRAEVQAPGFYNTNGQTLYTTYGSDGSVGTTTQAIVYSGYQLICQNPRAQGFIDGLTIPTYA
jgi:hypothetical protein